MKNKHPGSDFYGVIPAPLHRNIGVPPVGVAEVLSVKTLSGALRTLADNGCRLMQPNQITLRRKKGKP